MMREVWSAGISLLLMIESRITWGQANFFPGVQVDEAQPLREANQTEVPRMTLGWLKFFRLVIPGILTLLLAGIGGSLAGLWEPLIDIKESAKDLIYSIQVFGIGSIYYIFNFRDKSNRKYFDQVSENIRSGLLREADIKDNPEIYTWQRLRGVFYPLVDSDQSLKTKSRLAYFNGLLWTTVADLRALSGLFFVLWLGLSAATFVFTQSIQPMLSLILFGALYLLSFPCSESLTKRHIEIGNEQMEIIGHKYKPELREQIEAIGEQKK